MAPLSHAFDDLKSSTADTVVFPEPHVSCMVCNIRCNIRFDFRDDDDGCVGSLLSDRFLCKLATHALQHRALFDEAPLFDD